MKFVVKPVRDKKTYMLFKKLGNLKQDIQLCMCDEKMSDAVVIVWTVAHITTKV